MKLRHGILVSAFLALMNTSCSKGRVYEGLPVDQGTAVASLVTAQDWKGLIRLTEKSRDPLLALARDYAHLQLENFDKVTSSEILRTEDFGSYQIYLKALAAFQGRDYELAKSYSVPTDLPYRLRARLKLNRAQSFRELKKLDEARNLLIQFLGESKSVLLRGDALLLLADIEWELGLKDEALKRYRNLYESFPLTDTEDQAAIRLSEGGKFEEIDLETHLGRIQRLQRAAQFSRAGEQINKLLRNTAPEKRNKIILADAQLSFAMRDYSRSFKLSRDSLKKKLDLEQEIDWRNLFAWSLIRLGRSDEGQEEYRKLLQMKIPERNRETILLRLGASAIDRNQYDDAMKLFRELREKFPRGRFLETTHWFEAWALYNQGIKGDPMNEGYLRQALRLLIKLPALPEGSHLEPQSLYWRSKIHQGLLEPSKEAYEKNRLDSKWKFSFYRLLSDERPFEFLQEKSVRPEHPPKMNVESSSHFEAKVSWRRLEAFRAIHFMDWARLELEDFLASVQSRNSVFKDAVANRLRSIEDWPDLVRWTENNFGTDLESATADSDHLRYLYPRAHEQAVLKASREFEVSPYLIWAIMREESRFEVEIRSHAGAEGLMQLMPHLAKRIGRNLGDRSPYPGWMFNPKRNIRFGTFHLRELEDQVKDFPVSRPLKTVMMVAAYNAGIDPVRRWIKEQDTRHVDSFVESIPYTETKAYVKRVLQTAYIYHRLYKENP